MRNVVRPEKRRDTKENYCQILSLPLIHGDESCTIADGAYVVFKLRWVLVLLISLSATLLIYQLRSVSDSPTRSNSIASDYR